MKKIIFLLIFIYGGLIYGQLEKGNEDSLALVKISKSLSIYDSLQRNYVQKIHKIFSKIEKEEEKFNSGEKVDIDDIITLTKKLTEKYKNYQDQDTLELYYHLMDVNNIVKSPKNPYNIKNIALICVGQLKDIIKFRRSSAKVLNKKMENYFVFLSLFIADYEDNPKKYNVKDKSSDAMDRFIGKYKHVK